MKKQVDVWQGGKTKKNPQKKRKRKDGMLCRVVKMGKKEGDLIVELARNA